MVVTRSETDKGPSPESAEMISSTAKPPGITTVTDVPHR